MTVYQPITQQGFNFGEIQDRDPYLIPDDAVQSLFNAYHWRKRYLKKGGNRLLGRLGVRTQTIAAANGVLSPHPIEPGSIIYVDNAITYTDTPTSATTGTIAGGTINYTTGVYTGWTFTGIGSSARWLRFVDGSSPCMGLLSRSLQFNVPPSPSINSFQLIAFDTLSGYIYNNTTSRFDWLRNFSGTANECFWTGQDYNFFVNTNYANSFWVTNFVPGYHPVTTSTLAAEGDGIRFYDGVGWVNFNPPLDSSGTPQILMGARFILPFQGRLLTFNTWEGTAAGGPAGAINYAQRCRFSAFGTPYYNNAPTPPTPYSFNAGAWYTQPGAGGYVDAPTSEQITAVGLVKNQIIVFFEQSTWTLVATNNPALPFVFQRINAEFGADAPGSTIFFDKNVLTVGNKGVFGGDPTNIDRIDQQIPDRVFEFQTNNNANQRVQGIRNFFPQMVFWTYRTEEDFVTPKRYFPNRQLIYNYIEDSWATFQTSYTAFGQYQTLRDVTWNDANLPWQEVDYPWISPDVQNSTPIVVAGNQQGYVFQLSQVGDDMIVGNDVSLSIQSIANTTGIITSKNHNLDPGQFVQILDTLGSTELNNNIYQVSTLNLTADTFQILDINSQIPVYTNWIAEGSIRLVDNFTILSKRYNPVLTAGRAIRLGYVDFLVQNTNVNVEVQMFKDDQDPNQSDPTNQQTFTLAGSAQAILCWKRAFPQVVGQFFAFLLTHSEADMFATNNNVPVVNQPVEFHGIQMWAMASGRNVRNYNT